jgi:predicted Rossmann-fold nucleotide-binding protein
VVAVGGSYGTLSEIAIALKEGKTVISLGSWTIAGVVPLKTVEELDAHI